MSEERLTEAQREYLLLGAQKLAALEQKVIEAQRELVEAARAFEYAQICEGSTPKPQPERIPTHVYVRDSQGETVAMDANFAVLYQSSAVEGTLGRSRFGLVTAMASSRNTMSMSPLHGGYGERESD